MADYCFELLLTPSTHTIPDAQKNAARWAKWDIVEVYPAEQRGVKQGNSYVPFTTPAMPRTVLLFVTGVPDNHPSVGDIDLNFIRSRLSSPAEDVSYIPAAEGLEAVLTTTHRSKIKLTPSVQVTNSLTSDRYDTVGYAQAKSWMFNKKANRTFDEVQDFING